MLALALVTTLLINTGRARYAPVTLLPMLFVTSTTMTAGTLMTEQFWDMMRRGESMMDQGLKLKGALNLGLTVFVVVCVGLLLLMAVSRWIGVLTGLVPAQAESGMSGGGSAQTGI